MDIEQVQLEARTYAGIRRSVHHTDMQAYFGEVLPKVMGWARDRAASPPMAVWHGMDPSTGICDAQAGCFTAGPVEADGEITGGETPAGEALKLVHVGGYATVGASWKKLYGHAGSLGRAPGVGWEIYVDDPGQVAEEALRTELYLHLPS